VAFKRRYKMISISKSRLSGLLLAIMVFTLAAPSVVSAFQQICDPVGTPGTYPTGYSTHGYTFSPVTIRLELLATDIGGGQPVPVRQFDVPLPQTWSNPPNPEGGHAWGYDLLQAIVIKNPDYVVAGGIERHHMDIPCDYLTMSVYAVPGKRIAFRAISTANTPLPPMPSMPPLAAGSAPWPPAPQDLHFSCLEQYNYDYIEWGNVEPSPLGLVGGHWLAVWPDWNPWLGGLGTISGEAYEPNEYGAYFAALPGPVSDIPTVSQWGLIVLTGLLLTVGVVTIRQRARLIAA
jgi:hypothetical protein